MRLSDPGTVEATQLTRYLHMPDVSTVMDGSYEYPLQLK